MTSEVIPDRATAFGERVRRRLTQETAIWLTTVGRDGAPQPNPVGFLWDGGDSLLVYSQAGARRLVNIRRQPLVSLNFDSNGGEDIVVLAGTAEILDDYPAVPVERRWGCRCAGRIPACCVPTDLGVCWGRWSCSLAAAPCR